MTGDDFDPNVKQAADILNVSEEHVRRLLRSGVLKGNKSGIKWYIDRWSIDQFLNRSNRDQYLLAIRWLCEIPRESSRAQTIKELLKTTFCFTDEVVETLISKHFFKGQG